MAQITEIQKKEIVNIISENYYTGSIEDINNKSELCSDLGFDYLDFQLLVMDLEEHFNIKINTFDYDKLKTVEMVYDVVNNCL